MSFLARNSSSVLTSSRQQVAEAPPLTGMACASVKASQLVNMSPDSSLEAQKCT